MAVGGSTPTCGASTASRTGSAPARHEKAWQPTNLDACFVCPPWYTHVLRMHPLTRKKPAEQAALGAEAERMRRVAGSFADKERCVLAWEGDVRASPSALLLNSFKIWCEPPPERPPCPLRVSRWCQTHTCCYAGEEHTVGATQLGFRLQRPPPLHAARAANTRRGGRGLGQCRTQGMSAARPLASPDLNVGRVTVGSGLS